MVVLKSVTTDRFRKAFANLPEEVKEKARKSYNLWKQNNYYPGLHFKQIHNEQQIFSVRVGLSYRALGIRQKDTLIWFWIGSHQEYNNLISRL